MSSALAISDTLPYYEKVISSHHHELEGIFLGFIDYTNKTIEYSELITVSNIKMIVPPLPVKKLNANENTFIINSDNSIGLHLTEHESRFFDIIAETNPRFWVDVYNSYTLQISGVSNKTIKNIKKYLYDKKRKSETYESTLTLNGGMDQINQYYQENNQFDSIITYKYVDPVIRMVCEYMILLDDYFRKPNELEKFRIGTNNVNDELFKHLITFIRKQNKDGEPTFPIAPLEGERCTFGVGRIDCCSEILTNLRREMRIKIELFNLTQYIHLIANPKYINSPFHTLTNMKLPNAEDLLYNKDDLDNILLVKIMQKAIDEIIIASGRVEGSIVHGQSNIIYPKIHLLEVLDQSNTTWILRSERFHLSKSPCVHNGFKNLGKIDHFLKYLKICNTGNQLKFAHVSWLHTIGHTLDRLYCAHIGHDDLKLINPVMFQQIKKSFRIFMQLKSEHNENLICDVIPNDFRNVHYVDLFYYICMNDFESIEKKLIFLYSNHRVSFDCIYQNAQALTIDDYNRVIQDGIARDFEYEQLSESSIDEDESVSVVPAESVSVVPDESVSVVPAESRFGHAAESRLERDSITLIISSIKAHFNQSKPDGRKIQSCFPFFNIDFSYTYDQDKNMLNVTPGCNIKVKYNCKQVFNKEEQTFLREP